MDDYGDCGGIAVSKNVTTVVWIGGQRCWMATGKGTASGTR